MKSRISHIRRSACSGFTLLELMAAMAILTIAMAVAFEAFSGTIRGWKRGTEVIEGIKHGDFAMTQLASALHSTIYFKNPRNSYAFKLERDTVSGLPADAISFVTASSAFMPEGSPLQYGPHRLNLFIDNDEKGHPALFSRAFPAVADVEELEDEYDAEPHLVSRTVQGMEVLLYDADNDKWTTDEWENLNAVPDKLKLTLYAVSSNDDEEPIIFTRVIEIPVAPSSKTQLSGPSQIGRRR